MGKSVPTYNQLIPRMKGNWKEFRKSLRDVEQETFDRLWIQVKKHSSAAQYQANPDPVQTAFLCMMLEHQKELEEMEDELESG